MLRVRLCTTCPQIRGRMPDGQGLREKFLGALIIVGSDDSVRSHGNDLRPRAVERILWSGVFGQSVDKFVTPCVERQCGKRGLPVLWERFGGWFCYQSLYPLVLGWKMTRAFIVFHKGVVNGCKPFIGLVDVFGPACCRGSCAGDEASDHEKGNDEEDDEEEQPYIAHDSSSQSKPLPINGSVTPTNLPKSDMSEDDRY